MLVGVLVAPWVAYFTSIVAVARHAATRPCIFLVAFVTMPAFVFAAVAGMRSADPAAASCWPRSMPRGARCCGGCACPRRCPAILAAARYNVGLALAAAYYGEGGNLTTAGLGAIGTAGDGPERRGAVGDRSSPRSLLGVVFLGVITVIERVALRWHVSQRRRRARRRAGVRRRTIQRPGRTPLARRSGRRCAGTHRPRSHHPDRQESSPCAARRVAVAVIARRASPRRPTRHRAAAAPTTQRPIRRPLPPGRRAGGDRSPTSAARPTGRRHDPLPVRASTSPPPPRSSTSCVAEQAGYYDELCLDVELQPSFSTANYPLVAGGDAEFASGGSFSEVVDFAAANEADLVAVDVEGRTADRQPHRQAGHGDLARRARRHDDRRQGQAAAERRRDARRRRAGRGRRTTRPSCSTASTRSPTTPSTTSPASPATRATSPGSSSGPGCRSSCSIRPSTTCPARSA